MPVNHFEKLSGEATIRLQKFMTLFSDILYTKISEVTS